MISLPDFKKKQVLFIETEKGVKNRIKFQNDNIVYCKDDAVVNRASCHRVFAVFIIGDISITSELIKQGLRYGVSFYFLKQNLEAYASFNAAAEGNYLLRMRQYEMSDVDELRIAQHIVGNKVENQLRIVKSRLKEATILNRKDDFLFAIERAESHDSLRGIEGNVAKEYFQTYFESLDWRWRMPRAKPDIPNYLLDIGYTLLFNFTDALLRLYGFDTFKGCYHKLFFQRRSLACDIMEPFRPIIDRQMLKMHTLKQVQVKDFKKQKDQLILPFQYNRKYVHPFLETIMKEKEHIYLYVQGFYRHIMNSEKNEFPTFKISR